MATIDVRAGLGAALKRLVRTSREWPITDRRRFRNLLLDAVSSDAMPMAELLLRAHDDGLLRTLPDKSAPRAAWDTATARLASDLQTQRFLEPGIARFVAESWSAALGPEVVPVARVAAPRALAPVTRQAPRTSATVANAQRAAAATAQASSSTSAATMQAQRLTKLLLGAMAVMLVVFVFEVLRQTDGGDPAESAAPTGAGEPRSATSNVTPMSASADSARPAGPSSPGIGTIDSATATPDAITAADSVERPRAQVEVGSAVPRTSDDIVLNTGRVFEGRVMSIQQQGIVVKDEETGLDFEIAKADVDRIVTRDGRTMRFGDDNVPLIGDDDLTPMAHGGRYRVRYTERWGTESAVCSDVARRWAPGAEVDVRHVRGAPMLKFEFVGGQGFNAAVRADGLFESGATLSPVRGPQASFVSTRISGRLTRGGVLQAIARLSAVRADGSVICDLALTLRGERQR